LKVLSIFVSANARYNCNFNLLLLILRTYLLGAPHLEKGTIEFEGNSYKITSEEAFYFRQNLEIPELYNKNAPDLYVRAKASQNFPLLLARPTGESCGSILRSEGIQNTIKGFETTRLVESFLDTSGINLSNSRLLPIYCVLKDVLSNFELIVHRNLVKDFSLDIHNSSPSTHAFSDFIKTDYEEMIIARIEPDMIKGGSQVGIYSNSLDRELDRKEIPTVLPTQTILPDYVQFDSNENLILLVEGGENQYLEFKPSEFRLC